MAEETLPSDKTPSGKDRLEEKEVAEEVNGVGDVHVMGNGENEDRGKFAERTGYVEGGEERQGKIRLMLQQAKLLEGRGHMDEAKRLTTEACALAENDRRSGSEGRIILGECYQRLASCAVAAKNVKEATEYYEEAIKLNSKDAVSLHGLAVLLNDSSPTRAPDSVALLRTAVELCPDYAEAKRSLAVVLTDIGVRLKHAELPSDAFLFYSEALKVDPNYAQACYNLGVAYADIGMRQKALEFYSLAIVRNPSHAEAFCNAGVLHKESGNIEEAITAYESALLINPNFELAKSNLAIALCDAGTKAKLSGKKRDAYRLYKRALAFHASYPDAHYNLGVAYAEDRKLERAVVHYELAVKFNPNHTEAHNNLGVVYRDLGNLEKSLESYKSALNSDKLNHQTYNNIAVVYTLLGNVDLAARHLEIATRLEPNYAEAHNNIGVMLRDEGDVEGAIRHYEVCCRVDPSGDMAKQNRLHALNYVNSYSPKDIFEEHRAWGELFQSTVELEVRRMSHPQQQIYNPSALLQHCRQGLAGPVAHNLCVVHGKIAVSDPEANFAAEGTYRGPDKVPRGKKKPLRIGYISPDFFTHSVSYFIECMFAKHSENVEVYAYSNVQKADGKTERLKAYQSVRNHWREITGLTTVQTALLIAKDEIDILVELAGHTAGNRLDVMAVRPAPVQVTWIGYPNTTGLRSIDYRITDGCVDPVETTQQFTEKLWRLPDVFLCYTPALDAPEEVAAPPLASSGGIVTLGSFNILAKMQMKTVLLWSRLLKAIPNSRLLLKAKPFASVTAQQRVQGLFRNEGIDVSRLDLVPLIPATRSHMEAYANVDIALDPFPYAGTTTTCEALYMGVPVVTLASPKGKDFHAHNVSVSLLSAIGHPELIARDEDEYVQKVVDLASDVHALTKLRFQLREDMMKSPLGTAEKFVQDVEDAFYGMWEDKGGVTDRKGGEHDEKPEEKENPNSN